MGNSLCSSKCVSEGSSLDSAIIKCQNLPCKCALSCFNSVKDDIQIADKVKEFIEATIQQQMVNLRKTVDDDVTKPDILNDLP